MQTAYDAIVIGGGINGCGVARDLARRGVKVALIEKGDFAMGTSWASSGMIHGGVRYLLSDVHTTKKSCLDSGYIQKIAPHMIFRIPLLFPVLKGDGLAGRINLEGATALFTLYDRFQPLKGGKEHVRLSPEETKRIEPQIDADLLGAVATDEWGIDVPRLCIANAIDAAEHGADLLSWTRVTAVVKEAGAVVGLDVEDRLSGERRRLTAKQVVNCTGPWTPEMAKLAGVTVDLRPAKGVHLVLDRRISNVGVICTAVDGRQVFIIPHENMSLIGTTDDDFYGDLDDISILEDEIAYLMDAVCHILPGVKQARIVKTIAGVRPTLYERSKYEDDLTRDHRVYDHETRDHLPGFITLTGGKLAAYRIMAEETADLVCAKLGVDAPCTTHTAPLPGGESTPDADELAGEFGLDPYMVRRLIFRQGARARRVCEMIRETPAYGHYVCACEPVTEAEIRYVIRHEHVRRLSDLIGRCRLAEGPCQGFGCAIQATMIFGEERRLSTDESAMEGLNLMQEKWRWRRDTLEGPQLAAEELYRMVYQALLDPARVLKQREEVF